MRPSVEPEESQAERVSEERYNLLKGPVTVADDGDEAGTPDLQAQVAGLTVKLAAAKDDADHFAHQSIAQMQRADALAAEVERLTMERDEAREGWDYARVTADQWREARGEVLDQRHAAVMAAQRKRPVSEPRKFRKKPVVIEAVRLTSDNVEEVGDWVMHHVQPDADVSATIAGPDTHLDINTLEGTMRADINDWVIRGVQGEFYPCKPDIFAATYEPADPS